MTVDLSVQLGGLRLSNPVLTASGTFGYGVEYADLLDLSRLGGICVKGISLEPRAGNPPPRICETPCGMLNSIGLANIGYEAFVGQTLPRLREPCCARSPNRHGGNGWCGLQPPPSSPVNDQFTQIVPLPLLAAAGRLPK